MLTPPGSADIHRRMLSTVLRKASVLEKVGRAGSSPLDKFALISAFVRGGKAVSVNIGSARRPITLKERADFLVLMEIYGSCDYSAVREPRVPVIVDVGANIGITARYFADRFPSAVVHAIEPNPQTFARLLENTRGYQNIQCWNFGLGREAGELQLYTRPESHLSTSFLHRRKSSPAGAVPVRTLSDFMAANGISRIGLLKLDVEGFEAEVLRGLDDPIAVEQVIAELHPDIIDEPQSWFADRLQMELSSNGADRPIVHGLRPH